MKALAETAALLFALGLAAFLLAHIAGAVRAGRVRHTDSAKFFDVRSEPLKFSAVVALFVVLVLLFVWAALQIVSGWGGR